MDPYRRHVVVVGGGIAGLTAAWFLRRDGGDGVHVTVLEGSPALGGKLRVSDVAGVPVDEGADMMLARRPEGQAITRAAGLGDDLVVPATVSARVWSRGRLRPFPAGQVMGVPGDLRALAASGVLSPAGLARAALDRVLPPTRVGGDTAIGRYVAARLGREVVDRLVEPLLGGVYAGRADGLSLDATVPQLSEAARRERCLLHAVRRLGTPSDSRAGPLFHGVRGGLGRLPQAVAAASGAGIRCGVTVRELRHVEAGWQLTLGSAQAPETLTADAVVLAVPARPASRLLRRDVPAAAAELGGIDYASVAMVTLAYPRAGFPTVAGRSGFLVPPVEGRAGGYAVKAASYLSEKWVWLAERDPETVFVRLSLGRYGDEADLQRDDSELIRSAGADLARVAGPTAGPVASRVTRWGGALPQYAVGHRERVARIRTAVAAAPGLAVCGAVYDGVGVPACIASAEAAAAQVLSGLAAASRPAGERQPGRRPAGGGLPRSMPPEGQ
ncbi:MAG: protoporphyrinogen oxidase [Carbonactinosporaceae bacterium]